MSRAAGYHGLIWIVAALVALISGSAIVPAQEPGPWGPFQFLLGTWSATGSGQPGEAVSGGSTFAFDLDGKVLVRTNHAEYPPKPGEKTGLNHKDLLIIYPQAGEPRFRAVYFDNEGHVIQYSVSFPGKPSAVVFESDASEKGPRFRLVYELLKDGQLSVEFFFGQPGGELKLYKKGTLKKAS